MTLHTVSAVILAQQSSQSRDWNELFTALLVVVGFLQVIVMFLQFRIYRRQARIMSHQMGEMTKQRVTMHGQLDKMEGQLRQMESAGQQTERLIAEATKSADAASKGAEAALSNAHAVMNAERAWIMADLYWSADVPNDKPTGLRLVYGSNSISMDLSVVYTNEGDTPAWITESKILLRIVKTLDIPPDFTPEVDNDHWLIGPSPITPHGRKSVRATVHCDGMPTIGENYVVIYGYLKYRDVFSPERETRFGYRLTPGNKFERIVGEGDFWQYNSYT